MSTFLREFKEFAMRGNVVDLAVAVGAAGQHHRAEPAGVEELERGEWLLPSVFAAQSRRIG